MGSFRVRIRVRDEEATAEERAAIVSAETKNQNSGRRQGQLNEAIDQPMLGAGQ